MEFTEKDYRDLHTKWLEAELAIRDERIHGLEKANELLATDRAKKDAELNDVRHRFMSKDQFDAFKKQTWSMLMAVVTIAIGITALILQGG